MVNQKVLLTFFEASSLEQGKRGYNGDVIFCLIKNVFVEQTYYKT